MPQEQVYTIERGAPNPIVIDGPPIMLENYCCLLTTIHDVRVLVFFPMNISYLMAYTVIVATHDRLRHYVN